MKPSSSVGGVDSSENSFAVFLNSNQSRPLTTQKSHVFIPFNGNIADADPHKVVQISLTSMHFTNTIYNITPENNKLKWICYFAEARGKDASFHEQEVIIPPGFYNITQMSDYLSKPGVLGFEVPQVRFQYPQGSTYCNIFVGFGAIPLDANDSIQTKAAPTNNSNTKIVLQSPDLGHMIQFGTDIVTPVDNADLLKHSYVYEGVYLVYEEEYVPLLKMLGFFNINSIPPELIPEDEQYVAPGRPQLRGYGVSIKGITYKDQDTTFPTENTTFYSVQVGDMDTISISTPGENNVQFSGLIYQSPPGYYLTCLWEENPAYPGKVIIISPGQFISGTGISVPGPYVTAQVECLFEGYLEQFSDILTVTNVTAGSIVIGMAIANRTNSNNLPDAEFVYSQTSPNNYFYITGPGVAPNTYMLNQEWPFPDYGGVTPPLVPAEMMAVVYVITTAQVATPGGVPVNMLATTKQVTDVSGVVVPDNVTNMSGIDEIHVHCEQLRTKNLSSSSGQPLCASDVIAVVPVEVEFGFKQNYLPPNPLVSFLENTNIVNLEMRLTDALDRELNFNGVDWSLTLYCQEMEKESPAALTSSGTMNTPFQDQLSALEGTAWAQERVMRKNRQITFVSGEGHGARKFARRLY